MEPIFDPDLARATCPSCGPVVLVAAQGKLACPLCRVRDSAVEQGAVPAGPWPRLSVVRGEPLPGDALWLDLPGGERELDLGFGPVARVHRDQDTVTIEALAPGLTLADAPLAPGRVTLPIGARLGAPGRELRRTT